MLSPLDRLAAVPIMNLAISSLLVYLALYVCQYSQSQIFLSMINSAQQIKHYFGPIECYVFPSLISFVVALAYNKINKVDNYGIPFKMHWPFGLSFFIYMRGYSIPMISMDYMLFLISKGTSIMVIMFVGAFLSIRSNKKMRLTEKEILVGSILTFTSIAETVFLNPDYNEEEQLSENTNFLGYIMLVLYLLSSGFVFEWFAQVKQAHNPNLTMFMQKIALWMTIGLFIISLNNLTIVAFIQYLFIAPITIAYVLLMSLAWSVFLVFAVQLIKNFRQHIFPLVIFLYHSLAFYMAQIQFGILSAIYLMVLIGTIVFAFFEELKRNVDADGQKSGTEIELGGKDNASMTENYEMM